VVTDALLFDAVVTAAVFLAGNSLSLVSSAPPVVMGKPGSSFEAAAVEPWSAVGAQPRAEKRHVTAAGKN